MAAVTDALRNAAERGLLPPGASILLAVSGGADSMALLLGAAELAPAFDWRLSVGHVHHGWRGREADRDLAFVAEYARRLEIPFLVRRRDAREEARRLGLSPEAGARHVRYAALAEMAREAGAARIATAHQRDDRIESYLLARERKGGLASLAGPRENRADGVVRPLLTVPRREILAYLSARGLAWRRDRSNGDLRLDRNRLRRKVAVETGEKDLEAIARRVERLARRRELLDRAFDESVRPALAFGRNLVLADAAVLERSPAELKRRAVFECAAPFAAPGRAPFTGKEREEIVRLLAEGSDFRFEAGRRIRFRRRGRRFEVESAPEAAGSGKGQ